MYERRFSRFEPARERVWQVLTRHFFQQWIRPDHTVLDLGAGYCEFINVIEAREKLALDLNPETAKRAAPGVRVLSQDVSQPWPLPENSLDVVFTSNFFEHLPDKDALQRCMGQAVRALKRGGVLVVLGPNIRFCADVYWDFFDHYLPLSDRSVSELMRMSGLAVERVVPRFLPYTMSDRMPPAPFLVRAYLALPLAWKIFGKQFLVVGRKP